MAGNFNENLDKYNQLLQQYNINLQVTKDKYEEIAKVAKTFVFEVNESLKLQKKMKKDINGLANALKEMSETHKSINFLEKEREKIEKRILTATLEEKLALIKAGQELDSQIKSLKFKQELLEKNYRTVSKTGVVFREMGKVIANFPKLIKAGFGELKGTGIFEMDKAIRTSALSMGLLGSRSGEFRDNITNAQDAAIALGTTIQDLAEIQATYSDELGRAVLLSEKGLNNISDIAKGTGLGAEAAAKMTAEFNAQGLSTQKTADLIEQTMNDASSMGLNASKVIKNIQSNIKLLNRYNFKGGVKGLAKMAETVTKLGIDMETVAPMADKLFNIEGAVEMSAQLQVLGGKWSQLADPFKLMYQARNDMEGLVKSIGEAAAQSASLDADGNIKLASVEMARLRQVAEATGISYEQLAEAAKRAGKAAKIKEKISMTGLSPEEQEFLANVSEFENGRAFIKIGGDTKFLDEIHGSTKALVDAKMQEQKTLKERAKDAMTFDDQIKSLFDQLKQDLLPIAKILAKDLGDSLDEFRVWMQKEKVGERIREFANTIGSFIASMGKFLFKAVEFLGPTGTLVTWGALKAATWIANGIALGRGFNMVANAGGGGMGGKFSFGGKGNLLAGAGLGLGGLALDWGRSKLDNPESTGGKLMGIGGSALKGAGMGMMFGPWGAAIGGILGGLYGIYDEFMSKEKSSGARPVNDGVVFNPNDKFMKVNDSSMAGGWVGGLFDNKKGSEVTNINDGVVFNPNDKFMKVNDSTMIAGTNENGNKSLAKALMTTMVPSSQPSAIPGSIKLSDLNINGRIELVMNGERSTNFGKKLLSDPIFIRELSNKVTMAIRNATSGTQNQNPK